jgi:hypothetical protein
MVNSFPTFARCFVFAAFAAVTFAAPPPLPDVRTPFRLGVFARQEVVRQSADDYTCGYKHIHMIQSPERDFQSLKIELDKTTFSGPTSDRFASIEIRLAGSVPKAAHQDITNLVRFAVTPVAEGLADVCVSLDHAGAAARSPSNRPVFFDCRVSLPRNVPEPAWNAATGVFDIWQTDVVRHVTFTLPDSSGKQPPCSPWGKRHTADRLASRVARRRERRRHLYGAHGSWCGADVRTKARAEGRGDRLRPDRRPSRAGETDTQFNHERRVRAGAQGLAHP